MTLFDDIPEEVIISIAKQLDKKSLCRLIMSSKEFKKLCDTNDIWKYHYYLTIQHKWKITEDSVHIGGYNSYNNLYLYEFNDGDNKLLVKSRNNPSSNRIQNVENGSMWDYRKNVKFIKNLGCDPSIIWHNWWQYNPRDHTNDVIRYGCMCCQSQMIKDAGFVYNKPGNMTKKAWIADIHKKWKSFNESNGICNVCQDPTHYDIETLDIPSSCRGFKNYKKVIVKKLLTQNKKANNINYYIKREEKAQQEIDRCKEIIAKKAEDIRTYKFAAGQAKDKRNRLEDAIESM